MKHSKNPEISVIMSVFDGLPYLKEAVKSILGQTYKKFEFIIVDDSSNDGSWKYLKSIKDKRIKLIQNKTNLGLTRSLNKALRIAKGRIIARMDADDISLPGRFEIQLEYMTKNPQIDICGTWVNLIDKNGKIAGKKEYPTKDEDIKNALRSYQPIVHPTMMAKREVFLKLNGYDNDFDMAEDYELTMRAKEKYKMANIPKKLLYWRLWDKRRSRSQMKKMDIIDLKIKLNALKKGYFGPLYFLIVAKKAIVTFLIPEQLKIQIAKLTNLA